MSTIKKGTIKKGENLVCKDCGVTFGVYKGSGVPERCPTCRAAHEREFMRAYRKNHKAEIKSCRKKFKRVNGNGEHYYGHTGMAKYFKCGFGNRDYEGIAPSPLDYAAGRVRTFTNFTTRTFTR